MIRNLDWRSAGVGAALALAILEPPVQIISTLEADDNGTSYWWVVGAVAVLVAFAAGGWLAARRRPTTPFLHGAAAAGLAYVAHLVVRTVVRLVSGDGLGVNPASTLLIGQIAVSLGVLGAWVSTRRRPSGSPA